MSMSKWNQRKVNPSFQCIHSAVSTKSTNWLRFDFTLNLSLLFPFSQHFLCLNSWPQVYLSPAVSKTRHLAVGKSRRVHPKLFKFTSKRAERQYNNRLGRLRQINLRTLVSSSLHKCPPSYSCWKKRSADAYLAACGSYFMASKKGPITYPLWPAWWWQQKLTPNPLKPHRGTRPRVSDRLSDTNIEMRHK